MIYFLLHIVAFSAVFQDTLPPPVLPDTLILETIDPDTVIQNGLPDEEPEETEEPEVIIPVHVWNYENRAGFSIEVTDSTLRWMNMLSLTQHYSRRPGTITYRTGTLWRMDGIDHHAYENRHFESELNGMRINDPLTGAVNWSRVPTHKVISMSESDYGPLYRTSIRLRDHYLVQPRTYLNFDESSYGYRNLEFSATHNINQETNLELSYWDRRDGIGYNRSSVEGNQIVFKGYHQLSEQWLLRLGYINNSMDQEQSFGYQLQDPSLFTFNPFIETPNRGGAESIEGSKDIYVQLHHRDDAQSIVQSQFGLHYQSSERTIEFATDTSATNFRNVELFARHRIGNERANFTATARPYMLENRTEQLMENRWFGMRGDLDANLLTIGGLSFYLQGGGDVRNDSRYDLYSGGRANWSFSQVFEISFFGGYSDRSPDLQALYWQSNQFSGNPDLLNERSVTAGSEAKIGLGRYFRAGGRADYRQTEQGVFVDRLTQNGEDGEFVNIDPFTTLSGTGWLELESTLFEGMVSATYKTFESSVSENPVNFGLQNSGDRVWLKGNFYWKNYLFDRATFVKAGISGMYSPNFVRTAEYITPLNRWQHGTHEFYNVPFSRVDIDVSARVRWLMVLLRWENIFDRVVQPGYFETVGYPMPEQRFIFSLRVLFTN
ncbi:hypothetical protein DYD21_14535 [Rhodohalobacter sp. SW132]|uniref:hypothetical protein n=1 Tax=Rhodohalobacter sp. SW132 TaxID=2293433 RepID=UPI000E245307|nr:hypothetical protein [Rhodohalobacter sp. SW132]REL29076.1 hypothetical protein DYD21_14535 [Rhodohalobacter sp. SW132]